MAAANASLRVRCDHWETLLQERNDLKMCDHEECPSVLETAKNRLLRDQVSTEHEEQLQSCCRRKTGEYEPPEEEERCCDENTAAVFLGRFSRNAGRNFIRNTSS